MKKILVIHNRYKNIGGEDIAIKAEIQFLNRQLIALEKSFIDQKGMYYGDWFKSIYASSDPFSGYASWILPGIEYELAIKRTKKLKEWDNRYAKAIAELAQKMTRME